MSNPNYKYVGNSDSGMMFCPDFINGPIVIIQRDPYEVHESLVSHMGEEHAALIKKVIDKTIVKQSSLEGLRVDFNDINDRLPEIWRHCIGKGFDELRAKELTTMKIELINISGSAESAAALGIL